MLGVTPQSGREDQLPGEADDDEGQHGRQEDGGAVEGAAAQPRHARAGRPGRCRSGSAPACGSGRSRCCSRARSRSCPTSARSTNSVAEIVEADEALPPAPWREERQAQRLRQRDDHQRRVDEDRRRQKHDDVPAPGPAKGAASRSRVTPLSGADPRVSALSSSPSEAGLWPASLSTCCECAHPRPDRPPERPIGAQQGGECRRLLRAGLYQLSRPFCRRSPPASGVSVPLITLAEAAQVSFSRLGVPRDRIW